MTREQVLNSIQLKKRFTKDCNLPIAVFDNPYFYERLCTLDILFDCVDKFDEFCFELLNFADEQSYFEYYNSVKDAMITEIKDSASFQFFNTQIFKLDKPLDIGKQNLYIDPNDEKTFVSIDMRKANFSSLRHFSHTIFNNCDSWEKFVYQFTESTHIANSKYIRQVVLGACNPKKQIQYEHYLMSQLYLHLKDNINPEVFEIYSIGEDEILIKIKNQIKFYSDFLMLRDIMRVLKKVVASCPNGIGSLVRVEAFKLYKVGNEGWMKKLIDDDEEIDVVEFKCINAEIFHQVVKHYFQQSITENDLVFYHDGKLARFLKEVDNPWKTE